MELSKHLRNISAKSRSTFRRTICKMAAQKIDKLAAELEKTKAILDQALEDLKSADLDCKYCAHKKVPADCIDDEQEYPFCEACPHDCHCKDCFDNSKWEYQKIKEANQ